MEYSAEVAWHLRSLVLNTAAVVREQWRRSSLEEFGQVVTNWNKPPGDPTKAIDLVAEQAGLQYLKEVFEPSLGPVLVISEECGVQVISPEKYKRRKMRWAITFDPLDMTDRAGRGEGGWVLVSAYHLGEARMFAAAAHNIGEGRLYWATHDGPAEMLDFALQHQRRLSGRPDPPLSVKEARIAFQSTKPERLRDLVGYQRLLDAMEPNGRIVEGGGSQIVLSVVAGYTDAGVEVMKGLFPHDIYPGRFIAQRAGMVLIRPDMTTISPDYNLEEVIQAYEEGRRDDVREKIIATQRGELAVEIAHLLK